MNSRCLTLLGMYLACLLMGADTAAFDAANEQYEQGNLPEAIRSYRLLIESGKETPAVHFNLGNAFYRQGNHGMSIYHYLMAQALDPTDPDIGANLRFVRETIGLPTGGISSPIYQWIRILPLNAWALGCLFPFWSFCLLKALAYLVPASAKRIHGPCAILAWLIAPGILLLALVTWMVNHHHPGVVIEEGTELHASPFADSKSLGKLKAGQEILLLSTKNNWRQVRNADQETGWVRMEQFKAIPSR